MCAFAAYLLTFASAKKRHDQNPRVAVIQPDATTGDAPVTLLVVRHAEAGSSADWTISSDIHRPLSKAGQKQARRLVRFAEEYAPVVKVVSSPFTRAVQTVEPLAEAIGLELELVDALGDGNEMAQGAAYIRSLVAAALERGGGTVVVCGHGGLEHALGFDLPFKKGAVWVFEGGDLRAPARREVL